MSLRGLLFFGFALFIVALIYGQIGPESWNWIRVVLLLAGSIVLAPAIVLHYAVQAADDEDAGRPSRH